MNPFGRAKHNVRMTRISLFDIWILLFGAYSTLPLASGILPLYVFQSSIFNRQ